MAEGMGTAEQAAERLGEAMGGVVKIVAGVVESFGNGLRKGIEEQGDVPPPAPGPSGQNE